jgi:hypothetical protein
MQCGRTQGGRVARAWLAAGLLACQPIGPIAGGKLSGEEVGAPVEDWSFAAGADTIQLETNPSDPHSVTVWYVVHGGRLYVPSRHPDRKRWVRNAAADPRVRVKVGERIYPGVIRRVGEEGELAAVVPALLQKYELEPREAEGEDVVLFRIDAAAPSPG